MSRPQSRTRREATFMREAKRMYEQLEDWYDKHPQASFGEIEAQARKCRRELMGKALSELVNGRDVGVPVAAPKCEQCGEAMEFEGYRKWGIHGLEGDSELERAYYVCPNCKGETVFPPGSEAEVTGGSLERRGRARRGPARIVGKVL